MLTSSVIADLISLFATRECQKLQKFDENSYNTDEVNLHIFRTPWGTSTKFSGKVCLMIILKVTKNQDFTPFLENTVL